MCIVLKQLEAHYQKVTLHNELQICKFVLYDTFHQTLKHLVGWNIPKFVRICVFCNMTTLTLTLILCLFTNTIFEWILLHLTSMTKHIYNILNWIILKGQRRFFFHQVFGQQSWFDWWTVFGWLVMGFYVHESNVCWWVGVWWLVLRYPRA
jgi:hypothetical protein